MHLRCSQSRIDPWATSIVASQNKQTFLLSKHLWKLESPRSGTGKLPLYQPLPFVMVHFVDQLNPERCRNIVPNMALGASVFSQNEMSMWISRWRLSEANWPPQWAFSNQLRNSTEQDDELKWVVGLYLCSSDHKVAILLGCKACGFWTRCSPCACSPSCQLQILEAWSPHNYTSQLLTL